MTDIAAQSASPARILIVEDAPEFVELLVPLLQREGHTTAVARDGAAAIVEAEDFEPDVIILDLTLPKLDGVEVCRQVRTFSDAYVIMLTSRTDEVDRVIGLEVGADDYLTKPFSPRELAARVRAMLRRPRVTRQEEPADEAIRVVGDLEVDPKSRQVAREGKEVALTRIEFDLLAVMTDKPSMVFSRSMLRERVWGSEWFGDDHVIDVHIANLRKKLDTASSPSCIKTVRGVGYRMNV